MRQEWQDALELVLEENNAKLSPMANLGIVTASHAIALFTVGIQISQQMKSNIEAFKQHHAKKRGERVEQELKDNVDRNAPVETFTPVDSPVQD